MNFALLFLVVGLTRLLPRHQFIYIPIIYAILSCIMLLIVGLLNPVAIVYIIGRSVVIYIWSLALNHYENTIFSWLLVVLAGVVVLSFI